MRRMKNQKKNVWVDLAFAERIPHMQLCVIRDGDGLYHLARLDRSRDCWIEEGTKHPRTGGDYVMLINGAPGDKTVIDERMNDGNYVRPEIVV